MKKKVLAMVLSAVTVMSMLAGCGGTQDKGEKKEDKENSAKTEEVATSSENSVVTEPTELTFIFADGDEGAKEVMNNVVQKFNETYPDITVTIEPGNGGAYSEFLRTKDSVG